MSAVFMHGLLSLKVTIPLCMNTSSYANREIKQKYQAEMHSKSGTNNEVIQDNIRPSTQTTAGETYKALMQQPNIVQPLA